MESYYGMRRKRNIDLSRHRQPLAQENDYEEELEEDEEIVEMEEVEELEEAYEYEEIEEYQENEEQKHEAIDINNKSVDEQSIYFINGRPFVPKKRPQKETFADTHVRITTYIEKNLHHIIRMLQEQKQLESITKFMNDSIKDHLMNKYHQDN